MSDWILIKPLKENIGRTYFEINCRNIFLDLSLEAKEQSKNKQMKPKQTERFCTAKETIHKMKR